MQSVARAAAVRGAGAAGRGLRGVATAAPAAAAATEAERERVAALVRREVRAQLRVEEAARELQRAKEAELRARLCALEVDVGEISAWRSGFVSAVTSCLTGWAIGTLLFGSAGRGGN